MHPIDAQPRHSIHSYYLSCPESPDGKFIVYYVSEAEDAAGGDLVLLDRASGKERILVQNIRVEDAHRAACQQWCANGEWIAFQDYLEGRWCVLACEIASGSVRLLAEDCQIGFTHHSSPWIPIVGYHAAPGELTGIDRIHVTSRERIPTVSIRTVMERHKDWVIECFGGSDISLYFPVLNATADRVFFKVARARENGLGSWREGLLVADCGSGEILSMQPAWGHPCWHPDGRRIIESKSRLIHSETGTLRQLLPAPSQHPSPHPDGRQYVTDTYLLNEEGAATGEWAVLTNSLAGDCLRWIHRFDNSGGPVSERGPHPHPTVSADGKRIYYNVNTHPWTRVFVTSWPEIS